jgi:hypothetical protein
MQLTIRMHDEQMPKIEHIAKEMGLKKSDVTRMAIKKFIAEYIGEEKEMKPYNRVKHLLGVAESGVADLGQSHREHLIKKIKSERK